MIVLPAIPATVDRVIDGTLAALMVGFVATVALRMRRDAARTVWPPRTLIGVAVLVAALSVAKGALGGGLFSYTTATGWVACAAVLYGTRRFLRREARRRHLQAVIRPYERRPQ